MLVTVVVQFTTKTTNSKTVVYCLSLMPYSINKLKSYMLFTSKNFVFSEFMYKKKKFCSRKWWNKFCSSVYGPVQKLILIHNKRCLRGSKNPKKMSLKRYLMSRSAPFSETFLV